MNTSITTCSITRIRSTTSDTSSNTDLQTLQRSIHEHQLRGRIYLKMVHHMIHSLSQQNPTRNKGFIRLNAGIPNDLHLGIDPRVHGSDPHQRHFGTRDDQGGGHVHSQDQRV